MQGMGRSCQKTRLGRIIAKIRKQQEPSKGLWMATKKDREIASNKDPRN